MPDIQAEIRARRTETLSEAIETYSAQQRQALLRAERRTGVKILLAQGKSQQQIADALFCSQQTISNDIAYLRVHGQIEEPTIQGGFTLPAEPDHAKDDRYIDSTPQEAHNLAQKYALRDIVAQEFRRFKERKKNKS